MPPLWGLFASLKTVPVLAIRGANSDLLSAETLAAMQAAHPGLEAATVPEQGHAFPHDWAVHQLESTVDFARGNPLVSWYLGGLNFQVVHHLFPQVCHVHYPALSRIVEETCREFGVRYSAHRSFLAGVVSHYRWLRELGRPAAAIG